FRPLGDVNDMKTQKSILITAAIALLIAAGSARADTFFLTSDHCTGGCGTPPFGTVTLTQSGANVDVTVTLFAGYQFVKTGAGGMMYFLFDNSTPGMTTANITNIQSGPGGPVLTAFTGMPTIHADGTGNWMWGIGCASCAQGAAGAFTGPITFTVTGTTIAAM